MGNLYIAIFASTILLMGCVSTPVATEEEKSASMKVLLECLDRNAESMDDRISDAQSVSKVIMNTCSSEYQIMLDKLSSHSYSRNLFEKQMYPEYQRMAVTAVLLNRKNSR